MPFLSPPLTIFGIRTHDLLRTKRSIILPLIHRCSHIFTYNIHCGDNNAAGNINPIVYFG